MDNERLAKDIVDRVGGSANVVAFLHCVTRLRFDLADEALADTTGIEALDGVLGVARQGGQFQVIIGPGVDKVAVAVERQLGGSSVPAAAAKRERFRLKTVVDALVSIISPLIPALCAAGMMKVILLLLTTVGLADGTEGPYLVFSFIADVTFYFLPMLIAMTSAKRFNVDQGLAVCLGGLLLYPQFVAMVQSGDPLHFFVVDVPMYTYASTIFPALLGVLLLSYVHRWVDRIVRWDVVKLLLVPLVSLGITAPITLLVIAPLGNWGAQLLGVAFSWLFSTVGPLAGFIIGFLMPLMVLTGLHQSLAPIELFEITTFGGSRMLATEFFYNLALSGATLGTAVATRDKKLKRLAYSTGVTAFMGVTEPALYGVMVKDRYAMLSAMIGSGVGGGLSVTIGLKMAAYVWPNIFSAPTFLGGPDPIGTLLFLVLTIVASFGVAAAMPFIFRMVGLVDKAGSVVSPVSGTIVPLSEVNDEVFSKGLVGEGVAILPEDGKVYSPCAGEVIVVMPHAVGIRAQGGSEVLVHAGINTVGAPGLEAKVAQGQKVKIGQLLIEFDKAALEAAGRDLTVVVVRTNGAVELSGATGAVSAGAELFAV